MKKNIILTGSLAYDYIFDIPDSFSKYIQPDKIHKINISIVTDTHKKSFGGTAGNQAFHLARFGLNPTIITTVGNDFFDYKIFLKKNGVNTNSIEIIKNLPTAAGFVMTDVKDNQIWMFATGAMKEARRLSLKSIYASSGVEKLKLNSSRQARTITNSFVLISPTDLNAMINIVKESINLNVDFAFDPAFFIPHLPEKTLLEGVKNSIIIFGNDYEIAFIEKRLKKKITDIVSNRQVVIKTLGDQGSEIYYNGKWIKVGIYKTKTIDPTGAGDAYRAGFLYGFLNNQPLKTCGWMGAVTASFAVEVKGTMNLKFTKKEFLQSKKN